MKKEIAIKYAEKFASYDKTDTEYIENNTEYGLLIALQEEMGELISAIGKYRRTLGEGPITYVTKEEAIEHIKEELADVLATGILYAEKANCIDECIERHGQKSELCSDRIDKKKKGISYE